MIDYNLRYPIGEFQKPEVITDKILNDYISVIENFPAKIRVETEHLTDSQLDTQYRPEGWTIRQVVNHCADSHMNSLMRFKLALTEVEPAIRPYFEDRWAELADSKSISIEPALKMLEGIHYFIKEKNEMAYRLNIYIKQRSNKHATAKDLKSF